MSGSTSLSSWKSAAVVASLSAVGSYLVFKLTRPKWKKSNKSYTLWGKQVELDIPPEVFPTDAELSEMEDTMPHCQHAWFESTYQQGVFLHYRKFLPSTPIKGVVVYQHGIQTHSGKSLVLSQGDEERKLNMALMSRELLQGGFAVYALDMLGHGYSEGDRWYIPDWTVNRNDLETFARFVSAQHTDIPLFLYGESYGGTLVLHVAKQWQQDAAPPEFAGIVLSGPAIQADVPPYPIYALLRYVLAPAFPKWIPFFMPNPISPDRIWVDEKVRAYHLAKRNQEMSIDGSGRPFRLGTAVNMLEALELVRSNVIPGLTVPFCVIHGVQDAGCPVEGTDYLHDIAETAAEDCCYHRLENAYHDLLGDPAAEQTMEYMISFMNQQVSKKKK